MNAFDSLENRCRVCALELSDLTCSIPILEESSSSFLLQSKISKYLYVSVLEDDPLPKKICATCFLKIESIDKFAYSAAKNQECFLTWLKNKNQKVGLTQTVIETSTNSDFSFSNITVKNEFEQRQQIVFQPQKTRNPRHVDHITLEQIINDQIIKNPKLPASTTITKIDEPKRLRKLSPKTEATNNISIVSYHNLQIGQLIKDYELLKLILRALKWEEFDRKATYQELIERLRRSNCRDILTNKNLLSDNDVVQLLRSYVNDSMLMNLKIGSSAPTTPPQQSISKVVPVSPVLVVSPQPSTQQVKFKATKKVPVQQQEECISSSEQVEVSVDPGTLFLNEEEAILIEDDEETVSAAEAKIETAKLEEEPTKKKEKRVSFKGSSEFLNLPSSEISKSYICSSCAEVFVSNADLQNHAATHLITSTSTSCTNATPARAIVKPSLKKKKAIVEKLRSKRRKIVIRINPSPNKRHFREKAKLLPKFVCAICRKSLSSKRNLDSHQETHREANGKFRCDGEGCKKLFGKLENFVKHRVEHEKPPAAKRRKIQNEK